MEFSFRHELSISELPRLSISELPGERILKLKFPNKKKVMNIIYQGSNLSLQRI